jgi:hypothetical protein
MHSCIHKYIDGIHNYLLGKNLQSGAFFTQTGSNQEKRLQKIEIEIDIIVRSIKYRYLLLE